MNFFILILSTLTITFIDSLAFADCSRSDLSQRVQYFMDNVEKETKAIPSWYHHKLSEYPIILADSKSHNGCTAFWQPIKGWSVFKIKNQLIVEYDHYDHIYNSRKTNNTSTDESILEMDNLLQVHDQPFALLWVYGTWEPDLNDPLIANNINKMPMAEAQALATAIHEAFHFFIQLPQTKTWTKFRGLVSDEDLSYCYTGTTAVRKIHKHEMESLMDAFLAKNKDDTLRYLKKFLDLRSQRNSLIPNITYSNWNSDKNTISCREAEARAELDEGVPEFTGNALLLDLNLATRQQIAHQILFVTNIFFDQPDIAGRPIHSYYHTGSISLLLIRQFYGKNFLDFTRQISQPDSKIILNDILNEITNKH